MGRRSQRFREDVHCLLCGQPSLLFTSHTSFCRSSGDKLVCFFFISLVFQQRSLFLRRSPSRARRRPVLSPACLLSKARSANIPSSRKIFEDVYQTLGLSEESELSFLTGTHTVDVVFTWNHLFRSFFNTDQQCAAFEEDAPP